MDAAELATKTNTTVNSVLDIIKKEWFVVVLLWLVLIAELTAIFSGCSVLDVVRTLLVRDFGWALLDPIITSTERVIGVVAGNQLVVSALLVTLTLVAFAAFATYWNDGQAFHDTAIYDVAPVNLTLRFVVLTTWALVGGPLALILMLATAVLVYGGGAASTAEQQNRIGGFVFAAMTLLLLGAIALVAPFVMAAIGLWRAMR